jgi:tetratricopeptide (TPR) repeat protein
MAGDLSDPGEAGREVRRALSLPSADAAGVADLDDAAAAELRRVVSAAQAADDHQRTQALALLSVALALQRNDRAGVAALTEAAATASVKLGNYDAFAATLRALLRAAIERLKSGNIEGLPPLSSATLALAGLETAGGRYDAAAQLLVELQDYCDRLLDRYGRFLCLVLLTENAYFARDLEGMRDYALALSQAEVRFTSMDAETREHVFKVLFTSGVHVYAAAEFDVAKRLLERATAMRPEDDQARLWLGHCELRLHRDGAALAHYEAAARLRPDSASIHLSLSGLYFQQKEFDRALAAADRAIALRPDDERGHWNRAMALIAKERYGDAIIALKKVIELGEAAPADAAPRPSGPAFASADEAVRPASLAPAFLLRCYLESGDLAQADAYAQFLAVHAADPETKAAAHDFLGQKQDTDYLTAVGHLTQAIGQAPTIQHYRRERSDLHLRHGAVDKALADFETLVKAEPSEETAGFVAAGLSRIIAEHPANAQAHRLRGFMLHMTGLNRAAEQEFSRAIELAPDDADSWHLRGLSRMATSIETGSAAFPDAESITAGALDLARAVKLSNGKPAMVDALFWVIDHTAPDPRCFSFWFNSPLQQVKGHENIFLLAPSRSTCPWSGPAATTGRPRWRCFARRSTPCAASASPSGLIAST